LRVTAEVLARWDERARQLGRPPGWRLTDDQREANRRAVLGDLAPTKDLWFYAYGSLMWDPGIHFSEVRLATLEGFQRRFTYRTTVGRGSPECPALLLAIERQAGSCTGLAFRVAADLGDAESAILWRREMVCGHYSPAMFHMTTPQGDIDALVFTANPEHTEYAGELALGETAAVISRAHGVLGSNLSYLEQMAIQLDVLGIDDPYVAQIMDQVRAMCTGSRQAHRPSITEG
jgi:cation transport protein ChaC